MGSGDARAQGMNGYCLSASLALCRYFHIASVLGPAGIQLQFRE